MNKGAKLILLPNLLARRRRYEQFFPENYQQVLNSLDGIFVEHIPRGNQYLNLFKVQKAIDLVELNKNTKEKDLIEVVSYIQKGQNWGLLSDAGLPCIADPGSRLVSLAKKKGIQVSSVPGFSSVTLSLMYSGLNGQKFTFHGYIAKENVKKEKQLLEWQKSAMQGYTQIFIEAPHKNQSTFEQMCSVLSPDTLLCVAVQLTSDEEFVKTQEIKYWSKEKPEIHKKPCIFLFGN